jgi:hypothetical protein
VLGIPGPIAWQPRGSGFRVELSEAARRRLAGAPAWTLRIPAVRS